MLIKKIILVIIIVLNMSSMVFFVTAMPDPYATLTVWPYDTPEGAEGPIVTTSPANLIIYNNDNKTVLDDVWLLLVINKPAYDHLVSITTNVSLNFFPEYFLGIPGIADPNERIPPTESDSDTTPTPPFAYRPNGWPGIEFDDQYQIGSLRDLLEIPSGESMYYSVGDLDSSPDWIDHGPTGLNREDPEYFTITVDTGGWGGNWKVLVLALGHSDDYPDDLILNVNTPYTRSTLIVSELGTLLLAVAPMSAFGIYKIKYKIRKK